MCHILMARLPLPSQVLPTLQATTSASPRLHSLWNHLLPYLLPGFKPHKASWQLRSCCIDSPPLSLLLCSALAVELRQQCCE